MDDSRKKNFFPQKYALYKLFSRAFFALLLRKKKEMDRLGVQCNTYLDTFGAERATTPDNFI